MYLGTASKEISLFRTFCIHIAEIKIIPDMDIIVSTLGGKSGNNGIKIKNTTKKLYCALEIYKKAAIPINKKTDKGANQTEYTPLKNKTNNSMSNNGNKYLEIFSPFSMDSLNIRSQKFNRVI